MTTKVELSITRSLYLLAGVALCHYRTEITTGGDESLVDYILDGDRKLISAYWHNQSPLRFWFCHSRKLIPSNTQHGSNRTSLILRL